MTGVLGSRLAPEGVRALNPAFDVTPAELVTAIVTERGTLRPPFTRSLEVAVAAAAGRRPRTGSRDEGREP